MRSAALPALEAVLIVAFEQRGARNVPGAPAAAVETTLKVRVLSTGCTSAEDFMVAVSPIAGGQALGIVRTRPDPCRRRPFQKTIRLRTTTVASATIVPGPGIRILPQNPLLAATADRGRGCVVTGCSGQVCTDRKQATTCEWLPEYACYRSARCEPQADSACGWTPTPELRACLEEAGG